MTWVNQSKWPLISLRLGFRRNFLSVYSSNLVEIINIRIPKKFSVSFYILITGTRFIYIFVYYLRLSIKKGSRRLPQFTVGKNVLEFLNDLKFILYLKYDNFSTTWWMTYLSQNSLYNPTWNTQKIPHFFPPQYWCSSE